MKNVVKSVLSILVVMSFILTNQTVEAQTSTSTTPKFDVTILKADQSEGNKLGVSISHHHQQYQYTFQWQVNGLPAGNSPFLKFDTGKDIKLIVTRYPGGDQVITAYEANQLLVDLPLFPKKQDIKNELAGL